jgi:hypothetical protein
LFSQALPIYCRYKSKTVRLLRTHSIEYSLKTKFKIIEFLSFTGAAGIAKSV